MRSRIEGLLTPAMRALAVALLALAAGAPAAGADFRSIAANGTILYDAPSARARRLFVASQYTPVEIVVSIEGWAKVRDQAGDLNWVEKKALSELRTVVVTVATGEARQAPNELAQIAFQASRGVALELVEVALEGWVRVRHRDGQSGFMRVSQLWGL